MKSIPEKSSALASVEAASAVHLHSTTALNDAIVDAIAAGKVYPGNIVYHSPDQILSAVQQEELSLRFARAGWELHFRVGTAQYPHIHIYIAGEGASYLPVIPQPEPFRRRPAGPTLWQRLAKRLAKHLCKASPSVA